MKKAKNLNFEQSYIVEGFSIAGPKEDKGNLTGLFDEVLDDDKCNECTFEKAEVAMFKKALYGVTNKAKLNVDDVDVVIGGDLLNQIVSASFAVRNLSPSFIGIYNACATFAESLLLGASLVNSRCYEKVMCISGSHFSTAERQYRYPLELGVLRSPVSQWTATGVGSTLLSSQGTPFNSRVTGGRFGRVVDYGTYDVNNMGAAMAPSAVDTLLNFFEMNGKSPKDYDAIYTGDLGLLGSGIFVDMLLKKGIDMEETRYNDCGGMLFSQKQMTLQGGSGAACSALVFNSLILNELKGNYRKVLLLGTGALMSPVTGFQGESIPCITHCVELSAGEPL
ncbi:MAG: stage V sporulation protein AD [Clostridia bacterium]|nr:stage V sporulation protein AD [Clostridia bacterium]